MPYCYVALSPDVGKGFQNAGRAYRLLLPAASGEWPELAVRPSKLGGFGAHPAGKAWKDVGDTPILLPYLGAETVTKDHHAQKILLSVLKGAFERVTVGELSKAAGGGKAFVADGIFAVAADGAARGSSGSSSGGIGGGIGGGGGGKRALAAETKLLQVSYGASASCVCYVLADEARAALHLVGERSHLFDLLCAHSKHEHTDRHLATHIATVYRKEEGYVLINAHPAFLDPIGITGMVNEPPSDVSSTMKMTLGYAKLLPDGDPLLAALGVATQPKGAVAAWRANVIPPEGTDAVLHDVSERMVFYMTTRKHYNSEHELTVDYGKAYVRDYASGQHKAAVKAPPAPKDRLSAYQLVNTRWPRLPGWFNPHNQPQSRPAFEAAAAAAGVVRVCKDDPAVVKALKEHAAALGGRSPSHGAKEEQPASPSTPTGKSSLLPARKLPSPPAKTLQKRTRQGEESDATVRVGGLKGVFKVAKRA